MNWAFDGLLSSTGIQITCSFYISHTHFIDSDSESKDLLIVSAYTLTRGLDTQRDVSEEDQDRGKDINNYSPALRLAAPAPNQRPSAWWLG